MKKLAVSLLVLAVALGASACGSLGPTAATVNGSRISEDAIDEELEAIGSNREYREAIEPQLGGAVLGQGKGTFTAAFASQVLTRQIFFELVRQEVERRDLEIGDDLLRQARQAVEQQVGGPQVFRSFPEGYRDTLVLHFARVSVLRQALEREAQRDVEPPDPKAYYDTHPDEFVEVCASHILVETRDVAADVRARIQGGADFGTIAAQESTDPSAAQNRGELPCGRAGTYVPEFEAAARALEPGQVSEPVQTQFGFHVILLRSKRAVPFEDVEDQLTAQLANQAQQESQNVLDEFLQEAVQKAKVSVNEKYGRWVDDGVQAPHVEPPDLPATAGGDDEGPGGPPAPGGPAPGDPGAPPPGQ